MTATSIDTAVTATETVDADVVAIPVFEHDRPDELAGADVAAGGAIARAFSSREFTGKAYELFLTSVVAGGWRARRAFRMGEALAAAGFVVPEAVLVGERAGAGLLVTRDVGGEELLARAGYLGPDRTAKRRLLRRLGAEIARLHAAGFVHGDLVPTNIRVCGDSLVLLDNDRTRRSRLLVALAGRRNLVQLGRFVVPRLTLTDRARVLAAYARGRGLTRARRRRLAAWLVERIVARRCRIDSIPVPVAARAGFRQLMRSGGPFDPARVAGGLG